MSAPPLPCPIRRALPLCLLLALLLVRPVNAAPGGGAPVLDLSSRTVVQGAVVLVRVRTASPPSTIRLLVDNRPVPLHWREGVYQAFVGTSPLTAPGGHTVRVITVVGGRQGTAAARLEVRAGRFGVRRLTVPPALLDPALAAAERRRMAAATAAPLSQPVWTGPFHLPVEGSVTSGYGVRSVYNGKTRGYHLGVDIRAPAGTPVRAAQAGLVVLAEALPLSGLTVVLDHGAGIFTTYQHLSAILVRPGSRAAGGAPIGRVGSTGRSTGPHLHWGMRVHGVRVDPLPWVRPGPLKAP